MQMPKRKRLPKQKVVWTPGMNAKERQALTKQRKPNGTRKFSKYTLPKKFRKAPHTSGFEIEPKVGRPPYAPTDGDRAFVKKLSAYGMTTEQICSLIESRYGESVNPDTLRKYFRIELTVGTDELVAWAADKIVMHAKNNSLAAAALIVKSRGKGNWAAQTNLADPNGNPLTAPNVTVVFGAEGDEDEGGGTEQ
jgi:hypothetical protein